MEARGPNPVRERIRTLLQRRRSVEQGHQSKLLGHADEADGIEEYDNPLPDWYIGLFWLTIIWADRLRPVHYHGIAGLSFRSRFLEAEMAAGPRSPLAS